MKKLRNVLFTFLMLFAVGLVISGIAGADQVNADDQIYTGENFDKAIPASWGQQFTQEANAVFYTMHVTEPGIVYVEGNFSIYQWSDRKASDTVSVYPNYVSGTEGTVLYDAETGKYCYAFYAVPYDYCIRVQRGDSGSPITFKMNFVKTYQTPELQEKYNSKSSYNSSQIMAVETNTDYTAMIGVFDSADKYRFEVEEDGIVSIDIDAERITEALATYAHGSKYLKEGLEITLYDGDGKKINSNRGTIEFIPDLEINTAYYTESARNYTLTFPCKAGTYIVELTGCSMYYDFAINTYSNEASSENYMKVGDGHYCADIKFDKIGQINTVEYADFGGNSYAFLDGRIQTGWIQQRLTYKNRYYDPETGIMWKDRWVDGTYYVDSSGNRVTNNWVGEYYFDGNGKYDPSKKPAASQGWQISSAGKYWYRHADGSYTKSGWEQIEGKWYYFDAEGYRVEGKWVGNYYLQADGTMATDTWIGNYHVNSSGKWDKTKSTEVTTFTPSWVKSGDKWWYRHADGGYTRNGWEQIGGYWYHFDANGYMQTGWQAIGGSWYYLGSGGSMVTGWQAINGSWYYFTSGGKMVTGWQAIGGSWYYLGSGGSMVTGWQAINGSWYYFTSGGKMVTGWQAIGGKWYYFSSSGAQVTGQSIIDGVKYILYSNGGYGRVL